MDTTHVIQVLIGVATIGGAWVASYSGTRSAISVLQSEVISMKAEIERLREAKHEHASMLTQHHFRLHNIDKMGD